MTKDQAISNQPYTGLALSISRLEDWPGGLTLRPQVPPATREPTEPALESGEVRLLSDQAGHSLQVGLPGDRDLTTEDLRQAGGRLAGWLLDHRVEQAGLPIPALARLEPMPVEAALPALLEGLLLGAFRFRRHKSDSLEPQPVSLHLLVDGSPDPIERITARAEGIVSGVNLARDWAHEPPNVLNPATLAERARSLAEQIGVHITVLGEAALEALDARALLSVGRGSPTPSQLIVLEYPGAAGRQDNQPVVVVGKAITFDTGGYSLKTRDGMVGMKYDKCGGMAVLGLMQAAAATQVRTPVVGIIAAAENMISENAYRPNDIITTLSGKTVEIISADAEGRMVLADALTYAQRNYQPRALIDLATLTGGIITALGSVRAGLMANHDPLAEALLASGERTHERLWRMPLDDEYLELIRGDDSDLKNSGSRQAQPIIGGIFLKQFVDADVPWAHLDIAGTATTPKDQPYCPKGATGFGVRLLLDYLETL